jgi:glycosyltransferase involved in cell wall biosynthesis
MTQPVVRVAPRRAYEERRRLFDTLSQACGVSFAPSDEPTDAALVLRAGPRSLTCAAPEERQLQPGIWQVGDRVELGPLAGATLADSWCGGLVVGADPDAATLARSGALPAWVRPGPLACLAAAAPAELGPDERLVARFAPGRFAALLPILAFLREVTAYEAPPLRAAFVIDDPNLRRPSYGYVDFAAVAAAAASSGLHVVFGLIPRDASKADPRVVDLFRRHPEQLSLTVHGNDHVHRELGRTEPGPVIARRVARAVSRIESFERRTALPVTRVMVPPHSACSIGALGVLRRHGFAAITLSTPPVDAPPDALAGWLACDTRWGGVPILPRVHISSSPDELPLRAYLGHALILYGHHADLRDELERVRELGAAVGRLGRPAWGRLDGMAPAPEPAAPEATAAGPFTERLTAGLRRRAAERRDRLVPLLRPPRRPLERTGEVLLIVQNLSVPADRRVWQECRSLRDAGYRPTVVCPTGGRDSAVYEVVDGIPIHRYVPRTSAGGAVGFVVEYAWALWRTRGIVRRLEATQRFDVVHVANPPDVLFLTALGQRRHGARFVFDHHDLTPELVQVRFGSSRLLGAAARAGERLAFRLADVVVTTNETYREVALDRGRRAPEDVFVVRNGPDLRGAPTAPGELDLHRDTDYLLAYAGVMGPQDGVDDLLLSLAELRGRRDDWHAVLAGRGDALDRLQLLAAELELGDDVTFCGWLETGELHRLLASADVCLAPEPSNPLNDASTMVKVAEYMGHGRAVVATDLAETRRTAAEAAVYVPPGDPAAFAEGIARLLDDEALRVHLGRAAERRARSALSWERSEQGLLAAYRRALTYPGVR